MVYHIQPKPNSRLKHFLRVWCLYSVLIVIANLAFDSLYGEGFDVAGIGFLLLLVVIIALLNLRAWSRVGWFSPTPRETFLTVVEEGLLIEAPAKDFSFFLPWAGLSFRRSGDMLLIFAHGALRSILSFSGVPAARAAEILSALRAHTQQSPARHGLCCPEKAAAPFAPAAKGEALPPLPAAPLPPPAPLSAATPFLYTNTPRQWKECQRFTLRPEALLCSAYMVAVAALSLIAGVLAGGGEEWGFSVFLFLFVVYLICKLALPGSRRYRCAPGPIRMELTATDVYEHWDDGAWARFRLPSAEKCRLVRLPHVWCLRQENDLGVFLFDAGAELPPPLAHYRREAAPRNGLRAALAVALAFLCGSLGYLFVAHANPSEAELAFRALPQPPDAAALRAFAQEHFADAPLYDTPSLEPVMRQDGKGLIGYSLSFTEGAPDEAPVEGCAHLAWKTYAYLYPDGEVLDVESWPASWCPCEECTLNRLESLTAEE